MFGSDWWSGYGPWVVFFVGICVIVFVYGAITGDWPPPSNPNDPYTGN